MADEATLTEEQIEQITGFPYETIASLCESEPHRRTVLSLMYHSGQRDEGKDLHLMWNNVLSHRQVEPEKEKVKA